jgi:hypothetical protein
MTLALYSAWLAYDSGGGGAHIGAVLAQSDAPDQFADGLLAQVTRGVSDAYLGCNR